MRHFLIILTLLIGLLCTTALAVNQEQEVGAGSSWQLTNSTSKSLSASVRSNNSGLEASFYVSYYNADGSIANCVYRENGGSISLSAGQRAVITAESPLVMQYDTQLSVSASSEPAVGRATVQPGQSIRYDLSRADSGTTYRFRTTEAVLCDYYCSSSKLEDWSFGAYQSNSYPLNGGQILEVSPREGSLTAYWAYGMEQDGIVEVSTYNGSPIHEVTLTPESTLNLQLADDSQRETFGFFALEKYSYEFLSYNRQTMAVSSCRSSQTGNQTGLKRTLSVSLSPNSQTLHVLLPQSWLDSGELISSVTQGKPLTRHQVEVGHTLRITLAEDAPSSRQFWKNGSSHYSYVDWNTATSKVVSYTDDNNSSSRWIYTGRGIDLSPLTDTIEIYYPAFYAQQGLSTKTYEGRPLTYLTVGENQRVQASLPAEASESLKLENAGGYYSLARYLTDTKTDRGFSQSTWGSVNIAPGETMACTPNKGDMVFYYPNLFSEKGFTAQVLDGAVLQSWTVTPQQSLRAVLPADAPQELELKPQTGRYSFVRYDTATASSLYYASNNWGGELVKPGTTVEFSPNTDTAVFYCPAYYLEFGLDVQVIEGRSVSSVTLDMGDTLRISLDTDSTAGTVSLSQPMNFYRRYDFVRYDSQTKEVSTYGRQSSNFTLAPGQTAELSSTDRDVLFYYPAVLSRHGLTISIIEGRPALYESVLAQGETIRALRAQTPSEAEVTIRRVYTGERLDYVFYRSDKATVDKYGLSVSSNMTFGSLEPGGMADFTAQDEYAAVCVPTLWLEQGVVSLLKLNHPAFHTWRIQAGGTGVNYRLNEGQLLRQALIYVTNDESKPTSYVISPLSGGSASTENNVVSGSISLNAGYKLELHATESTSTLHVPYRQVGQGYLLINGKREGIAETTTEIANQANYKISAGDFTISVRNRNNVPLEGATVTVDGQSQQTDLHGRAVFSGLSNGGKTIRVTMEGYNDLEIGRTLSTRSRMVPVVLERAGAGAPYVMSASLTYQHQVYDIRNSALTLYKLTESEKEAGRTPALVDLDVRINWGDHGAGTVYLYQSASSQKLSSSTGMFTSQKLAETFSAKGANNFYVYGVAADGTKTPNFKINLTVSQLSESSMGNIADRLSWFEDMSFGDKISFVTQKDIPFLSEMSFDFDISKVPSFFFEDEGSIYFAFGVNKDLFTEIANAAAGSGSSGSGDSDPGDSGSSSQNQNLVQYFKQTYMPAINDLKSAAGRRDKAAVQQAMADLERIAGTESTPSDQGLFSLDLDIQGYAQLDKINGEIQLSSFELMATGSISAEKLPSIEKQFLLGYVPVYVDIGLSADAGVEGGTRYQGGAWTIPITISASVGVSAGAGVGICSVAQAGVRGNASLDGSVGFPEIVLYRGEQSRPIDSQFELALSISGSMALEAKLLGQTVASLEVAQGTFNIWPRNTQAVLLAENGMVTLSMDSVDLSQPLGEEDRSYLERDSAWLGGEAARSELELLSGSSQRDERLILTNVPWDIEPLLVQMGEDKLMFWLSDDPSRSDRNRTVLVYSLWSPEDGSWSSPLPLWENEDTADFYPSVQGEWIVWQKLDQAMAQDVSINDMALRSEIAAAHWNGTGFDEPFFLTDNDILDCQPVVASGANTTAVLWTRNSENNLLGTSGTNSVIARVLTDGVWGEEMVLTQGKQAITALSALYQGDTLYAALNVEGDAKLDTADDRQILLEVLNSGEAPTEHVVTQNALAPQLVNLDGTPTLFYQQDGSIWYLTGLTTGAPVQIPGVGSAGGTYQVVSDGAGGGVLLWTQPGSDGQTAIFGSYRDGSGWTSGIQLSQEGDQVGRPSGILSSGNVLELAYIRTAELLQADEETGAESILYQSDLYTTALVPAPRLLVDGLTSSSAQLTAGEQAAVTFTVTNCGELPVESVQATLLSAQGHIPAQTVVLENSSLAVGESKTFTLPFTVPSTLPRQELQVSVLPLKGGQPAETPDSDGSQISIPVGGCDLTVTDSQLLSIRTQDNSQEDHALWAVFTNTGLAPTGMFTVGLYAENGDACLASQTIQSLEVGESIQVNFDLRQQRGDLAEYYEKFYLLAECETDQFRGNDRAEFVLERTEGGVSSQIISIEPQSQDPRQVTITAQVDNSNAQLCQGTLLCALYDSQGKLLGLTAQQDYRLGSYENQELTFQLTLDQAWSEGCSAKLFCLDSDSLAPQASLFQAAEQAALFLTESV